jgi:hypothetical protein
MTNISGIILGKTTSKFLGRSWCYDPNGRYAKKQILFKLYDTITTMKEEIHRNTKSPILHGSY